MNPRTKRLLTAVLGLSWLALAVSFYYYAHRPFSPGLAANLAGAAWQVVLAFLLLSAAGGLGRRLAPGPALGGVAQATLQAALGLGVMSLMALLYGALLGLNWVTTWSALALLLWFFRRQVLDWWREWGDLANLWEAAGRLGRSIAVACGLIAASGLFVALAPPLKFDSLVYHLTLPRIYLAEGRILYVPEIMYWGFPQAVHALYAWGMALGIGRAAVVGWWMGVLALLGVVGYVGRRMSVRHGWVAAAALLAGFSLASSLGWGHVDWPGILMGWAFLAALDVWRQGGERRYLLLGGAFAGLAVGVKYSAGVLWFGGLAVILAEFWQVEPRRNPFRWHWSGGRPWQPLLQFSAMAGVLAFPWLLKNWLATGNPLYPSLFPGGAMDTVRLQIYQGFPVEGDWRDVALLPVRATFWGLEVAIVGDAPGYYASIGPLLLGLGALAWLGWRANAEPRRISVANAALVAGAGLAAWALAGRVSGHLIHTHLYYALFPAFAVLAAAGFAGLERLSLPGVRLGRVAGALALLVLGFNALQVGVSALRQGAPQLLLGLRSEEDYLSKNLGAYHLAMRAVEELPPDSRVLMLWEARGYYCFPKCEPDEIIDRWPHDLAVYGGPDAVLEAWRQAGFTHLLYYQAGADFIRRQDARFSSDTWEALDDSLSRVDRLADMADAYHLYSLSP